MKATNILNKCFILCLALTILTGCGKKDKTEKSEKQEVNNIAIDDSLRSRLAKFAARPRPKGQFAFYVYDLTADKPVYGVNERHALPVASCLKLLSGVAGLHLLGTQYRYYTLLCSRGTMKADTLCGDVTFKAGLDPQLNEEDLTLFARALKKRGIKSIKGKVVLDLVVKDAVKSEPHWFPWDLSFSRYGLLYKGSPRIQKALQRALQNQGIRVTEGQMAIAPMPRGSRCIFRFSRPIDPVIERMWKHSSNTQATSLLYAIGHRVNPKASPTAAGVTYLHKFLREDLEQTDPSLVVHDGCGLCTYNRLSASALTSILRYGYRDKGIYTMLNKHLSISGVDGTLRAEMNDAKLRGKIHGKTGTLSHPYGISSLAGYCIGKNGHELAFAIIDSEMSVLDARVLQERLGKEMVN